MTGITKAYLKNCGDYKADKQFNIFVYLIGLGFSYFLLTDWLKRKENRK